MEVNIPGIHGDFLRHLELQTSVNTGGIERPSCFFKEEINIFKHFDLLEVVGSWKC